MGIEDYERSAALSAKAIGDAGNAKSRSYWSPYIAYTNQGLALYRLGNLAEAEQAFERAREVQPNLSPAHYHLGLVALSKGDLAAAQEHFERALELRPNDPFVAGNLAFVKLHRGDARGCVDLLEPLVAQETVSLTDRRNYGSALLLLQEFPAAVEQFRLIVAAEPERAIDRAKMAWALNGMR